MGDQNEVICWRCRRRPRRGGVRWKQPPDLDAGIFQVSMSFLVATEIPIGHHRLAKAVTGRSGRVSGQTG